MGIVAIGGPANLTTTVPIAKWFVRKRGRAMAIVTIGPFAGGVIFVPFTQLLIDTLGWRNAWITLAIIGAGTIILLAPLFIRRQPEDMGLSPDGDRYNGIPTEQNNLQHPQTIQSTNTQGIEVSWTLQEALHSYTFWRLTVVFSLVMLATSTAGLHRIPNFVDKGLEPGLIALAMSLDAAIGGVSTFAIGMLSERIPIRFLGSFAFLSLAIAIFLTITANSALLMFLSFALFGAGIGGMMMLNSFLWADYFGRTHLGSIRGFVMPVILFFSAVGAPLAGYIKDATGTYNNVWWVSIIVLLFAIGVLARTPPPTLSNPTKT
jgi:predicted MFS family arabinose efflux permease